MIDAIIGEDGIPVCGVCMGKLSTGLENYGSNSQGFFFVKRCSKCDTLVQYGVTFNFQKRFSGILLSTNENANDGVEEEGVENPVDSDYEGGETDADSSQKEWDTRTV